MPRFIKRKQLDLKINDAPKNGYGVEFNKANLSEKDQLELALDKLAVLLDGRSIIELDQIWVEASSIPITATNTPGIVEQVIDVTLPGLQAEPNSYKSVNLNNIVPEYFGDKISYRYIIKNSIGTIIDLKTNHGYVDPLSGTLTFVNGNPVGVSHNQPPSITCYRYIGRTAEDTGIGGGSGSISNSQSQWQNSVIDFTTNLPINPLLGDRYIFDGTNAISTDIIIDNQIVTGTINIDDIITWSELVGGTNSTAGTNSIVSEAWEKFIPEKGTFTSIDNLNNKIYYYRTGFSWQEYKDERTYPIEIELEPQFTYVNNGTYGFSHILSDDQILEEATLNTDFNLYINGVKIPDTSYDFVNVTLNSNAIYNTTSGLSLNEIYFTGSFTANKGDLIRIVNTSSSIIWRTVINVDTNILTYSGTNIINIDNAELYTYSIVIGNFPKHNSRIILKEGLTYDVEAGLYPDHLTFNYVKWSG